MKWIYDYIRDQLLAILCSLAYGWTDEKDPRGSTLVYIIYRWCCPYRSD